MKDQMHFIRHLMLAVLSWRYYSRLLWQYRETLVRQSSIVSFQENTILPLFSECAIKSRRNSKFGPCCRFLRKSALNISPFVDRSDSQSMPESRRVYEVSLSLSLALSLPLSSPPYKLMPTTSHPSRPVNEHRDLSIGWSDFNQQ